MSGNDRFIPNPHTIPEVDLPSYTSKVHYVLPETGEHVKAIVIREFGTLVVNLAYYVDGEDGQRTVDSVTNDESGKRLGSWHWPE
jgi:hypothetical protein